MQVLRPILLAATALGFLAPLSAFGQGGPDANGHLWDTTTYDFVVLDPAAGGSGTALAVTGSDQEFDVTLPWAFPFYGSSYTTVSVGENGGIVMAAGAEVVEANASLPATTAGAPDIAVFWDAVSAWDGAAVGGIFTYDDTTNSRFIVSWEGVGVGSVTGSFQVQLMHDGTMSFHYANTDGGAGATIGIQAATAGTAAQGNALQFSYEVASITDGVTAYAVTFCGDNDGDAFVNIVCGGLDCDDGDSGINPAAAEVSCDGIDNDCLASTNGEVDIDGDSVTCGFDCDDTDASAFPGNPESCDDGIDNDCDPSTLDLSDDDGDGATCVTDCDDSDPLVNPSAPEICGDGIDQDCDSVVDELVDDAYALPDDGSVLIGLCGFDFPFCGTDWDNLYVQSNGRLTFGADDNAHTESAAGLLGQAPQIDAFWNDLDPTAGGSVSIEEVADAGAGASLVVTWSAIPELGSVGSANSATLTLFDDGTAALAYGGVSMVDGLVGFACGGSTTVVETDVTSYELLNNAWAVGTGTEDALYELFDDQGNPNDLSNSTVELCLTGGVDGDGDGWTDLCGDCDDSDATSNPSSDEVCIDGADNDCDGLVDNRDLDGDGETSATCGGEDCDDDDPTVNSNATEVCNGIDDDCSGAPETGSEDLDADGYLVCGGDCDDGDSSINPDAVEVCDQTDNDCDGVQDNGFTLDVDGDGVLGVDCGGTDCDDSNDETYPEADEVCDTEENDCNGAIDDIDVDGDEYIDATCRGDDCDDTDAAVNPGATEVPYDAIDNDCSEGDLFDVDGDGFFGGADGTDCDDEDADINPGAAEQCEDGIDNNCDGGIDGGDKDSDTPADLLCASGCSCAMAENRTPAGWMLLFGFAGLALRRRRRVVTPRRRRVRRANADLLEPVGFIAPGPPRSHPGTPARPLPPRRPCARTPRRRSPPAQAGVGRGRRG